MNIKSLARNCAVMAALSTPAFGAVINLSSWTPLTLDFPGGQAAGNWVLGAGNTSVTQTVNADPSFFLNNINQTAYSIDGSWQVVSAGGDNDYMGFVFGYQNSSNFYLFDWKAGTQANAGRNAAEGMTIKQFTGATGNGLTDLSVAEFWENEVDFGDMDVLATNHSTSAGWVAGTTYNFHLDFNVVPGQFSIVVKQGATELWNQTVNDSTFTGGQFGFFNNSQQQVKYEGFEQEGGTRVPDGGSTFGMLAIGLALLRLFGKRAA
ncbi:MAG TPA: VPDSG-CTERM sorting domain-containing protein [Verrucomicrobiales bacterium]|jgi:hypothetical protein|nr:VPDSG-CTERM sorting domain-containing protein [Verrucomicrobiales bacterium]